LFGKEEKKKKRRGKTLQVKERGERGDVNNEKEPTTLSGWI